jgi:hypothetical protein
MNSVGDTLSRWIRVFSHREKIRLNYFFKSLVGEIRESNSDISIVKDMRRDLGSEIIDNIPCALPSCLGMFIAISFLSITWYNNIRFKERAYYASLLYIDLDYTIDNSDDPSEYIRFIGDFINDDVKALTTGAELSPVPEGHRNLTWYRAMIGRNLKILTKVQELFNVEVLSSYIQSKSNSRKKLNEITKDKSGKTGEFICAILEIEDGDMIKDVINVGYISQLIDDMYDIREDMKENINTMPSHDIIKRGNMDDVLIETIIGIGSLDCKYNLLRYILLLITLYIVTRHYQYFSKKLLVYIDPYTILDFRYHLDLDLWL